LGKKLFLQPNGGKRGLHTGFGGRANGVGWHVFRRAGGQRGKNGRRFRKKPKGKLSASQGELRHALQTNPRVKAPYKYEARDEISQKGEKTEKRQRQMLTMEEKEK